MSDKGSVTTHLGDAEHLAVLGYNDSFKRSMSFWANFALGFTYLSPLVGVYSLFAVALSVAGPPSIFWILIVGGGQLLVSLVFGEVVSQFPISGGIYPWARRLWGKRYAWMAAWVYIWAMIVTITAVADYGSFFLSSLLDISPTRESELILTLLMLGVALALNFAGTKTMARVARIGLAAELSGVIVLGLYLLIFQRRNDWSVFVTVMGNAGEGDYTAAFIGAAIAGLFLFYGFEACGDVAEEVENPGRSIPRAMYLTILIGGVSALLSFAGYVMASPNLISIVNGEDMDPIPGILETSLGTFGAKVFLVIAVTAFLSCVLSLQAAASRLLYSFSRDEMLPGHTWMAKLSSRKVPANALLVASIIPALIAVIVYAGPAGLLLQVTAFAVLGIYIAFQAVVLAALRKRVQGWQPAGQFSLGKTGGWLVNILALAWGLFAMFLLAKPGQSGDFVTDYIVLIGLGIVAGVGALYLFIVRPGRESSAPENDALEVAEKLRAHRG
jgi:amino acid transporter